MNKHEALYKHIRHYTEKNTIQWRPSIQDEKKFFLASSKKEEALIFDNKYNLLFCEIDLCFYRKDFLTGSIEKITTKETITNSNQGRSFLKDMSAKLKKDFLVND